MKTLQIETWINEFNSEIINVDKIKEYLNFIEESVKSYDPTIYSELHHVMSKCIDKLHKYDSERVRINDRNHYIAHYKLVNCFNNELKYRLSFSLIRFRNKVKETLTFSELEEIKVLTSIARSYFNTGRKYSDSTKAKMSISITMNHANVVGELNPMYNKRRITNGKINTVISSGEELPEGWSFGMTCNHHDVSGENNPFYGKFWITDGVFNKYLKEGESIPEGWHRGTTLKTRKYHLICKKCNKEFLGNSPTQKYCNNCKS